MARNREKTVSQQRSSHNTVAETGTDRRQFLKTLASHAAAISALPVALAATTPTLAAAPIKRPIIDAHMHVWANDPQRYPFAHPYAKDYEGMPHEGTVEMRKQWHNLKYYTWIEQQGKTVEELDAQLDPEWWVKHQQMVSEIDAKLKAARA